VSIFFRGTMADALDPDAPAHKHRKVTDVSEEATGAGSEPPATGESANPPNEKDGDDDGDEGNGGSGAQAPAGSAELIECPDDGSEVGEVEDVSESTDRMPGDEAEDEEEDEAGDGTEEAPFVRPPRWVVLGIDGNPNRSTVDEFKEVQQRTLSRFRSAAAFGDWGAIHHAHYDWWMFPIDDGSREQYNVLGESDIAELKSDAEWRAGYHESIRHVATAWGWDLEKAERIPKLSADQGWRRLGLDVRLAKIIRSLWLFEEADLLRSMQVMARTVKAVEKRGRPFTYGSIVLDEILHMALPRRPSHA